jgi:G3E family GTPase
VPVTAPAGVRWSRRAAVHDDEISSFLLEAGEVDLDRIGTFVQSLIDELGDELLRYKGILAIPDEDRKLIFQGVQRVAGFDYGEVWAPGEARVSRIVLIGKRLPEARLREAFRGAADAAGGESLPRRPASLNRRLPTSCGQPSIADDSRAPKVVN